MRSRKNSRKSMIFLAAGLLAIGVFSWFFISQFSSGISHSLRTVETINPDIYYENAVSLRGNTYRIDAEIDQLLGSASGKGRLISVILNRTAGENRPSHKILPVLVPPRHDNLSIQKGQHYLLKVKVADNGLLSAEELIKL